PDELARLPHHLVDLREPDEPYTAADFVRDAEAAIAEITARGARPLLVGGTWFYLKALLLGTWDAPPTD
ncbi:tRNA dimethylallyltransferase, partial [Escherichia coli]